MAKNGTKQIFNGRESVCNCLLYDSTNSLVIGITIDLDFD